MSAKRKHPHQNVSGIDELLERLSAESFREWYQERQYRQNIEEGQSYFNGSSPLPDSERHSPSQLLQCHRKILYRQKNAPEEQADPDGIFWFGTRFEEDIVFPFLRETFIEEDIYVQNSVWIDFETETDVEDIRIKGATDPVLVDADAVPILPTEIKTKASLENLESPNEHHQAQLHAYMRGLCIKYDIGLDGGLIIYGSRESLDVKPFYIEFDSEFWTKTVLEWAQTHTEFRLDETLPPADPEYDWECRFCSYRERCGEGDSSFTDTPARGFLPGLAEYPRNKVVEYLEATDGSSLTPTLARVYPQIAREYQVSPWRCPKCNSTFAWDAVESKSSEPLCPECADSGRLAELTVETLANSRTPVDEEMLSIGRDE